MHAAVTSAEHLAQFKTVLLHGWAVSTLATYGTALALYHRTCDALHIAEADRAPVASDVFVQMLVHLAGTASAVSLTNLQAAVHAWHLLNRLPWSVDRTLVSKALDAARALTPPPCAKHDPYTVNTLERVLATLSPNISADIAVFACACVLFWAIACTGELTVPALSRVNPAALMHPVHMHTDADRGGNCVMVLHVPYTKSAKERGEDLSFASQPGLSNPVAALERQVQINLPLDTEHLFTHVDSKGVRRPLSRSVFLARIRHACVEAGVDTLSGHAFRIGGTLEYLLCSLSLDAVCTLDRWSSDAFALYLRKHSQIMAPYLQADPQLLGHLTHVLPPVH